LEFDNGNRQLFDNYKDLLFRIDDSIKVLKKNGFALAEVQEFNRIDSLTYKVKIKKYSKFEFIKLAPYKGNFLESVNKLLDKYLVKDKKIALSSLDEIITKLSDFFSSKGFPFVEIKITYSKIIDSKSILGNIEIISNEARKIDGYIVKGYEKFPKKFIERFLEFKIGEKLDVKKLKSSSSNINSLQFVRQTREPEILFTKDSTFVYLYYEKLKQNNFDGLLTFSSGESDNRLTLNGYLKLLLLNSLNYGETIKVDYNSVDESLKTLKTNLKLPFIFNSNFSIESHLNITQNDSLYTNSNFLFKAGLEKIKISNYLGVNIENSTSDISNNVYENFKSVQVFYELYYQLFKSNNYQSDKIFSISAKFFLGHKNQLDNRSAKNNFDIDIFKKTKLFLKTSLFSTIKYEKLVSQNLVNNEMIRFGGAESIRGFIDQSISANEYFLSRNDLKFMLNNSFSLIGIIDYAYYVNDIFNSFKNIYSLGIGFNLLNDKNLISLNYASGSDFNQKLNFKNARLSINFITFF
jgi:hemolysin activation/secretion protein